MRLEFLLLVHPIQAFTRSDIVGIKGQHVSQANFPLFQAVYHTTQP